MGQSDGEHIQVPFLYLKLIVVIHLAKSLYYFSHYLVKLVICL